MIDRCACAFDFIILYDVKKIAIEIIYVIKRILFIYFYHRKKRNKPE